MLVLSNTTREVASLISRMTYGELSGFAEAVDADADKLWAWAQKELAAKEMAAPIGPS